MNDDFELLGVSEDVTLDDLKERFRAISMEKHPDHGGDTAVFQDLLAAYRRLERVLKQPKSCDDCHGSGKMRVQRGFTSVKIVCTGCNGQGVVPR